MALPCSLSFCTLTHTPSPRTAISSSCVLPTVLVSINRRLLLVCVSGRELPSYIRPLPVFSLPFSASQKLFRKLSSFCGNVLLLSYNFIFVLLTQFQPPLSISGDDHIHYRLIGTSLLPASAISNVKIVTILILECACTSYASQSQPTRIEALDRAYFRYIASGVHDQLTKQFYGPPEQYSARQFMEFISEHRL